MVTRSKLVEQLRECQVRSQQKYSALTIFSPKPHIVSWAYAVVAIFWAVVFITLIILSYVTLYFRYFWLSFAVISLGIFLPVRLQSTRQALTRKKERRTHTTSSQLTMIFRQSVRVLRFPKQL